MHLELCTEAFLVTTVVCIVPVKLGQADTGQREWLPECQVTLRQVCELLCHRLVVDHELCM